MTDPIARWATIANAVSLRAKAALANPALAEAAGLHPIVLRVKGQIVPEAAIAPWLRAAAEQLVPACFEYEILNAVGGQAYLVVKRYHEDREPPAEV